MSGTKELLDVFPSGSPEFVKGEFVCLNCFEDYGLREFIRANRCEKQKCSYCDPVEANRVVAPVVDVAEFIQKSIMVHFDIPENCLPYDGREGGWQGETWDTYDLLTEEICLELPNDTSGGLFRDLCEYLGDGLWCKQDPMSPSEKDSLSWSWKYFCETVKHQYRFFFDGTFGDREIRDPVSLLEEILRLSERFGLVVDIEKGESVFRGRKEKEGGKYSRAVDLGPPQPNKSKVANRMSPPGISVFYGARKKKTVLAELAYKDESVAIGRFVFCKRTRILDLSIVPLVPGYFERKSKYIDQILFLNELAKEISKPIDESDRDIEYAPTQIVFEYLRRFGHKGLPIDGVVYRSSKDEDGKCIALFVEPDKVLDKSECLFESGELDPMLVLERVYRVKV